MKWDIREPCKSCPYRKDVPLATWHPEEFRKLRAAAEDELMGGVFGCHKYRHRPQEEHRICAGYMITQRENGVPSIQLRLQLLQSEQAVACLNEVHDGGHALYETIEEMCDDNLEADQELHPERYE